MVGKYVLADSYDLLHKAHLLLCSDRIKVLHFLNADTIKKGEGLYLALTYF